MTLARLFLAGLLAVGLVAVPSARGQTPEDFKKAIERLEQATKDLKAAKDELHSVDVRSRLIELNTKIDLIDKDIQAIKQQLRDLPGKGNGAGTSQSLRVDPNAAKGMGRLRLVNEFSEEVSVVVNGMSHRIAPGNEKVVAVTPGEFNYQVLQLQRTIQVRRIAADEVKTIKIFPLP